MAFESEKEFEAQVRELIGEYILPCDKNLVLFDNKKAVDILLCRNGKKSGLYFLEIKYHKRSHGRLSTGHGKGGGFQPEILLRLPTYFESNMRWVLGLEDQEGYFIMKNSQLIKYVAGGVVGKKYNNIQMKLFKNEKPVSEKEFVLALKGWLCEIE